MFAPYEADAQMAYLDHTGYVDAVLTEDSDLIAHGCRKVLYKMDENGSCMEMDVSTLHTSKLLPPSLFSEDAFLLGCVLSGCDYLKSLERVGIKTAFKIVSKSGYDTDKAVKFLRLEGFDVPTTYKDDIEKAIGTFKHQTVYDMRKKILTRKYPTADDHDDSNLESYGPLLSNDIATGICECILHPITRQRWRPEEQGAPSAPLPPAESNRKAFIDTWFSADISGGGNTDENKMNTNKKMVKRQTIKPLPMTNQRKLTLFLKPTNRPCPSPAVAPLRPSEWLRAVEGGQSPTETVRSTQSSMQEVKSTTSLPASISKTEASRKFIEKYCFVDKTTPATANDRPRKRRVSLDSPLLYKKMKSDAPMLYDTGRGV
eukprot:GHVO01017751.1.p1 GENE.GHVO01017751.1~~GHVO01017751.1.p1  ORF type:complete len:373 (-),score=81.31 GHVO01017751.1:345-1463(-)